MSVVSQEINEAFHEIAGYEYDGETIVELILFLSRLVQWIQHGESQCQQKQGLNDMMSDDPQNRSVYSDSEVSKEDIL